MNLPPEPLEADLEGRIMRGLERLRRDYGITDFLSYQHAGRQRTDRGIAAGLAAPPRADGRGRPALILPAPRQRSCPAAGIVRPGDTVLPTRSPIPA